MSTESDAARDRAFAVLHALVAGQSLIEWTTASFIGVMAASGAVLHPRVVLYAGGHKPFGADFSDPELTAAVEELYKVSDVVWGACVLSVNSTDSRVQSSFYYDEDSVYWDAWAASPAQREAVDEMARPTFN